MTPLSRQAFSELLKVSPATITNWMDAGMPAERTGRQKGVVRICLETALPWVVSHRETKGSERERLAAAQAEKHELENARKRGELIYADQVAEVLSTLGADVAARMDAISGRLAGELAGLTDPAVIRGRLRDEHRSVRGAFADAVTKLSDALGAAEDDGEDSGSPAEPDTESVGGRKSRPAAGKRRARAVSQQ